jgi:hypothetical protein
MFKLERRRDIQEVALTVSVSWLPLVLATPHRVAYAAFAVLFMARFVLQPRDAEPPTFLRRLLLIGLGCSAIGCLAWSWLPLFFRRPA